MAVEESFELLTFALGGEEYGIDTLKVHEIRGYEAVTTIANAREFIKGVTNLRGIIVQIVDIRIKFKLGKISYDENTVVIVLNFANRAVCMVADDTPDAITLKPDRSSLPPNSARAWTPYLHGPGTVG